MTYSIGNPDNGTGTQMWQG